MTKKTKLERILIKIRRINRPTVIEILSVGLVLFVAYVLMLNNNIGLKDFNNGDVQRGFQRGVSMLNGVNPYLEFDPDHMLVQQKVPGFFPLYFWLMAFFTKISDFSFVLFIDNLRYFVFFCYLALGVSLYLLLREKSKLIGIFSMFIHMFNRWTVIDVIDLKQDAYVCLILLLSIVLLRKNKNLSFLLYGIATAIKHLTILILPLYIFELIFPSETFVKRSKRSALALLLFLAPIVIPSIPFLIETPKHFVNSIMFQVTRRPEVMGLDPSTGFNRLFVIYNQDNYNSPFFYFLPRLPMMVSLLVVNLLLLFKKISMWRYIAATYLVFVGFNSVLFLQYYTWLMLFIPLGLFKDSVALPKNSKTVIS